MATTATEPTLPQLEDLPAEQSLAELDAKARELLGISGEEFLRRLDAGEYDDLLDDPGHHLTIGHLWDLSVIAR